MTVPPLPGAAEAPAMKFPDPWRPPATLGEDSDRNRALGNTETTKHPMVSGSQDQADSLQRQAWRLQTTMWAVTSIPRLRGCHRWRAPGAMEVGIVWGGGGSSRYNGLQNSHSVWSSPIAAGQIVVVRQDQVAGAVTDWLGQGDTHTVALLTLTLRHRADQSGAFIWDTLGKCWQGVTNTASWRGSQTVVGDKADYGIEHFARSTEATHGPAGWHIHSHVLLFLDDSISEDRRRELLGSVYQRWAKAAVRAGMEAPTEEHGVDLTVMDRADATAAGKYLIKGLAAELTGGSGKSARGKNRTPFQILADIADAFDRGEYPEEDIALWREWEEFSSGRKQLLWSRGAKEALHVDEVPDEDISDAVADEDNAEVVATLPAPVWRSISDNVEVRRRILAVVGAAETADQARGNLHELLVELDLDHQLHSIPLRPRAPDPLPTHPEALARDLAAALLPSQPTLK